MEREFKEQGGVATMDPGTIRRWFTSRFMSTMASEKRQLNVRKKAERLRVKRNLPHIVEYFHQVNDGYSHLTVQLLQRLQNRYDVELHCHLVSESLSDNIPEPELLLNLACRDASSIAPHYALQAPCIEALHSNTPPEPVLPQSNLFDHAASVMAALDNQGFIAHASDVSTAVWQKDQPQLDTLAQSLESAQANEQKIAARIEAGNARRQKLGHYSGATFYYAGEWYWGVDRLYHLEQRLAELGLDRTPNEPLLAARPQTKLGPQTDNGELTLELYASLRSPYSAIAFDRTVQLAKDTGVRLKVKPVLPMVMRGVPATLEKGKYILFDAGREARAAGVAFGACADPIGEPVRRAYSLYAWAETQGKGVEFFSAFLKCAWVDAVNTNTNRGMQKVISRAGLKWSDAKNRMSQSGWEVMLEENRLTMYELGLWGVPSYRLLDKHGTTRLSVWGQDRLWLVANEIQQQLQSSY